MIQRDAIEKRVHGEERARLRLGFQSPNGRLDNALADGLALGLGAGVRADQGGVRQVGRHGAPQANAHADLPRAGDRGDDPLRDIPHVAVEIDAPSRQRRGHGRGRGSVAHDHDVGPAHAVAIAGDEIAAALAPQALKALHVVEVEPGDEHLLGEHHASIRAVCLVGGRDAGVMRYDCHQNLRRTLQSSRTVRPNGMLTGTSAMAMPPLT